MVSPGSREHSLQTEQRAGSLQAPAGTGRLFNAGKMQIQTASLSLKLSPGSPYWQDLFFLTGGMGYVKRKTNQRYLALSLVCLFIGSQCHLTVSEGKYDDNDDDYDDDDTFNSISIYLKRTALHPNLYPPTPATIISIHADPVFLL